MPVHTELADRILPIVVRGEYTSAELRQTGRDALVAILAPDDLAFGLMRAASVFLDAQGLDAEVFRSEDEARAWLYAA